MDVKFREATDQDYGHIKELSQGIYGNTDTLLYSFLDWLKSDEWYLFVGEVSEDTPISFIAVQVTDGMKGLNLRCARVAKHFRSHGFFRALVRYAVQCVMERVTNAKYVYRIQEAGVRVPNGYEVQKEIASMTVVLNGSTTEYDRSNDFAESRVRGIAWSEFKALYEMMDEVKDMFYSSLLAIDCDICDLSCVANWDVLEKRTGVRIMLTEDEGGDGKPEMVISFLRLEKYFTNEGTFVAAVNLYGLKEDALKCHIARGLLETSKHVGGEKCLLMVGMAGVAVPTCVKFLRESCGPSGCDLVWYGRLTVLRGDLNSELEDVHPVPSNGGRTFQKAAL